LEDLNEVNSIDRETSGFDTEEADVINTILPFKDCVAHVGDRGWGNGLWNDLQVRVYITELTPEEISVKLKTEGLKIASTNFEKASLTSNKYQDWDKYTYRLLDAPEWSDLILSETLDFYVRRNADKTVTFVFLHADRFETEIGLLLDSFKWPN
jgi:hypothetical protein